MVGTAAVLHRRPATAGLKDASAATAFTRRVGPGSAIACRTRYDGSFIRHLATDQVDQQLVRAIAQMARSWGKETIAEFVENEESLVVLRHLGVHYVQGFHIGRPSTPWDRSSSKQYAALKRRFFPERAGVQRRVAPIDRP